MILLAAFLGALFCFALALASYLHLLYSESQRLRPREAARSLPFFEETLRPRLKLEPEEGIRRFVAVKQSLVPLLALDLAYALAARRGLHLSSLFEALVLATLLLVLFAYVIPHAMLTRTAGLWALRFLFPARLLAAAVKPLLVIVSFGYGIADLGAAPKSGALRNTA